ncbi:hypothetical protein OHA74_53245 [Streptomyces phaeochromogenes]|uniref:hypothetical protein n=1 Tax=Streptomyces phaeochromogenes TaxID=1923 RepID=UPI002E2A1A5D|nr:hypothetical protein [Streptomyces phaeochromogenes]
MLADTVPEAASNRYQPRRTQFLGDAPFRYPVETTKFDFSPGSSAGAACTGPTAARISTNGSSNVRSFLNMLLTLDAHTLAHFNTQHDGPAL